MPTTTGTIKHRFQTSKPNRASVDVSRNAWDDSLVLAGAAADGQVVTSDSTKGDGWGWSTPAVVPTQALNTTDTPQFSRLGVNVAADAHARLKVNGQMGSPLYDAGNSGAAKTIDWDNGNAQYLTLTGAAVLTLNNPISGFHYALYINTGAGGFTPTFPGSLVWFDAVPTPPTTAGKLYAVVMVYLGPAASYAANFTKQP